MNILSHLHFFLNAVHEALSKDKGAHTKPPERQLAALSNFASLIFFQLTWSNLVQLSNSLSLTLAMPFHLTSLVTSSTPLKERPDTMQEPSAKSQAAMYLARMILTHMLNQKLLTRKPVLAKSSVRTQSSGTWRGKRSQYIYIWVDEVEL